MALPITLTINHGLDGVYEPRQDLIAENVCFVLIFAVAALISGLSKGRWRFVSLYDAMLIMYVTVLSVLCFTIIAYVEEPKEEIARTVPIMQAAVLVFLLAGPRMLRRFIAERKTAFETAVAAQGWGKTPILLVGAGEEAYRLIRALKSQAAGSVPIGILDDGIGEVGRELFRVPILGRVGEFSHVLQMLRHSGRDVKRVVLTTQLSKHQTADLVQAVEKEGLQLCGLPHITDFRPSTVLGRVDFQRVNSSEYLRRPESLRQSADKARLISASRILITGSGGSIGSELATQIARCRPKELVLLDSCEYNLYSINQKIRELQPNIEVRSVVGDVRDYSVLMRLMQSYRPEIVFHAAALKHVPLVEANVIEAVKTNVLGTRNVANAALSARATAFVQVSTDKAVRPTSAMGATKRMAEFYCQALDVEVGRNGSAISPLASSCYTRFVTVRFGNVLGSSGSVLPLFEKQLERGGPLTVTHPDVTRFMMTVGEAVGLVLEAAAAAVQHEVRGEILVLDMGKPVRIMDIAERVIRLAGLEPFKDIAIEITGLRPGEKLSEELFDTNEEKCQSRIPGVLVAKSQPILLSTLAPVICDLERACRRGCEATVLALLEQQVPGYSAPRRRYASTAEFDEEHGTWPAVANQAAASGFGSVSIA